MWGKKGQQTFPECLNYALLSQVKILIGSFLEICQRVNMHKLLSTPEIIVMADMLQECLSRFPRIQSLKAEKMEVLEALYKFCQAKLSFNLKASVLVISPFNSIVVEQVNKLSKLGLPAIHLTKNNADCMEGVCEGNFRFIFCCAMSCLSEKFPHLFVEIDRHRA